MRRLLFGLLAVLALGQGTPAPPAMPSQPPPPVTVSSAAPPLTVAGVPKSFPSFAGWNLTTFPFSSLKAARGYPYQLLMLGPSGWTPVDPVNHPDEVDTSQAFMTYADAPGKVELVGAASNPDKVTALHPGWNLLGIPSSAPVRLDRLTFTAPGGVSRLPSEAANWVYPVLTVQDAAGQRTRDVRSPGKELAQPGTTAYLFCYGELSLNWNLVPPRVVPHIASLSAASLAPGRVLELTGAGFGAPGQGQVTLGGIPVQPELVQSWSDARIRMVVPPAAHTGDLVVFVNRYPGNRVPFQVLAPQMTLSNLTGRVQSSDGSPLVGALVEIDDGYETRTLPDGSFVMPGMPAGEHRVYVSLPGYKSGQGDIALRPGETRNLLVSLSPAGARAEAAEQPVDFTVQAYAWEQSAGRRWWPSRIEVWEYGTNRRNWVRTWDRDLGNTYEVLNCDGGLVRRDYNVRITWKSGHSEKTTMWTPELERAGQTFSYYNP